MPKFLFLIILFFSACSPTQDGEQSPVVSGEILFKAKQCYSCHTIGQGILAGPDLKGLFSRRNPEWVRAYLNDPVQMTQTDPIARELKRRFKIQMPRAALSPAELEQLLGYLETATR